MIKYAIIDGYKIETDNEIKVGDVTYFNKQFLIKCIKIEKHEDEMWYYFDLGGNEVDRDLYDKVFKKIDIQ